MNAALVDHAGHIDNSRMFAAAVSRQVEATAGQTDLLTTNLQTTTRDLVDLAVLANSNDAVLKQQVAYVVDITKLTTALDTQVRVCRPRSSRCAPT